MDVVEATSLVVENERLRALVLGRLSPRMAGVVEAARREVWGGLP